MDNLDYRKTAVPFLESLSKETKSTACFGLIVDEYVFVVAKHEADLGIRVTIRLGYRFPITYGAHGKAIVAFLPKVEREKILATEKLWFHGDVSRLNMERLRNEFVRCRQLGFAQDIGEMDPRFNAVAAPVFGLHGKLVASIFVVGVFAERLVKQYGYKVAECTRKVSYTFGVDVEQIYENLTKEGL